MRVQVALLSCLAALATMPGATLAGIYSPPPGDTGPAWSPDGTRVAFVTGRESPSLAVVSTSGSPETRLVDLSRTPYHDPKAVALSPDWSFAAVERWSGETLVIAVVPVEGAEGQPVLVRAGRNPAWSPDSRRLAFLTPDRTLVQQAIDGSGFVRLAEGAWSAAWSPDRSRIAFSAGERNGSEPLDLDLYAVDAEGGNGRLLAGGGRPQREPRWSPDGTRIAFLTQRAADEPFVLGLVRADGSRRRVYDGPQVSEFAWMPDGRGIVYARAGGRRLAVLDLVKGKARQLTSFGETPAVSPDGRSVAFSGGGECRDRSGIYVTSSMGGKRARRITNDCRILGTAATDVLRGSELADVLVGLAGADRLYAHDPGYMGDTLLSGQGDDLLVGGYRNDLLRGGPGRDRLFGGVSHDLLYGGPGRDRLEGQAGRDRIFARDGERDIVLCGTNLDRRGDLTRCGPTVATGSRGTMSAFIAHASVGVQALRGREVLRGTLLGRPLLRSNRLSDPPRSASSRGGFRINKRNAVRQSRGSRASRRKA